jgi:hypothetical protein
VGRGGGQVGGVGRRVGGWAGEKGEWAGGRGGVVVGGFPLSFSIFFIQSEGPCKRQGFLNPANLHVKLVCSSYVLTKRIGFGPVSNL